MKINILLILTLISINNYAEDSEAYKIELFCQDMNVVLQKVQTTALNIANHKTTRTPEGGFYKRMLVKNCIRGHCQIERECTHPMFHYEPGNPDSNEEGYVAYPSFSLAEEKAKLIKAQNAYDLIIHNMPTDSKALLVGDKYKQCFNNYKFFKEQFNFKEYLGRD